jgi:hypothetical protein
MKRRGATIERYAVFNAAIRSKMLLESGHCRPEDELSALDDTEDSGVDFWLYLLVLCLQIEKWYQVTSFRGLPMLSQTQPWRQENRSPGSWRSLSSQIIERHLA